MGHMFGGGPSNVQSTQSTAPPAWLQPFLVSAAQTYLGQVSPGNQLAQPGNAGGPSGAPGAFPIKPWDPAMGQQIAPLNDAQGAGLQNVLGATGGTGALGQIGAGQLANTIGGAYQGQNPGDPYFQGVTNPAFANSNPSNSTLSGIMQGNTGNPSNPYLSSTLNPGYASANPTNPYLQGMMQPGANANPTNPYLQSTLQSSYLQNNPTNPFLGSTMRGDYLGANPVNPFLGSEIRGDYLNSNPYIDSVYGAASQGLVDQYKNAVAPAGDIAAMRGGVAGGTAARQGAALQEYGLGRNLSDMAANIYGQNYANERGIQQNAAQLASQGYQQERSQQAQAAAQAGQQYTQAQQQQLAAAGQLGGQFTEAQRQQLAASGQLSQNYQQALGNQLQAAGLLGQNYGQGINQQLAAAGQYGQNYGQAINQQLAAAGQLGGNYDAERARQLAAVQQVPGSQQSLMQPGMAQLGAGTFVQGQNQAQLDANSRNAIAANQYPFTTLSGLMGMLGAAGGGGGQSISIGPNPGASKGLF